MLEGLEISEINFSKAFSITGEMRWDSHYYQKRFLENGKLLHSFLTDRFTHLCKSIRKGIFDLPPENYIEEGIPFIRTSEIKSPTINFSSTAYISEEISSDNFKTELTSGDLVFTKIGAYIGDVALLPSRFEKYNFSQNVAGASVIDKKDSAYLLAFFLSKEGKNQILRSAMISGQGKLELEDIRNYEIPSVSDEIKSKLRELLHQKQSLELKASKKYNQAEILLLNTLGMTDFLPSTERINIKSFKDSFTATGRLDAEYYQPKFEQMVSKIIEQDHARLVTLVNIQRSIEPGSDAYSDDVDDLPFLRVADYSKYGIAKPQMRLSPAFVTENRDKLDDLKPKKNTILFSKDGTVGEAYCLREDANFVTSGAVLHLTVRNPNQILPDYLTLVLNSKLVKMQAERDAGGSIILHWRVGEIENVLVPLVDMPTQEKITAMVQESFSLKTESERLLDVAKRAVEIAIEQDENAGMAYIEVNS